MTRSRYSGTPTEIVICCIALGVLLILCSGLFGYHFAVLETRMAKLSEANALLDSQLKDLQHSVKRLEASKGATGTP